MLEDTALICKPQIPYCHGREPGGALPHPGAVQEQEWVQTRSLCAFRPRGGRQGGHTIEGVASAARKRKES